MQMIINLFIISSIISKIIFQDHFDTFDFFAWKHYKTLSGGGNWEFELYDNNRSVSFVDNGNLHIKPVLLSDQIGEAQVKAGHTIDFWGGSPADYCTQAQFYGCQRVSGQNYLNPIKSARIQTKNFSFKYGKVQVRAKLPRGDWLWPAIWMLPVSNTYGTWPASGEIDIMQSRGNANYDKQYGGGIQSIGSTLHWGPDYAHDMFTKTHGQYRLSGHTFADDFHTFGLYWSQKQLYTYVDKPQNKVFYVNMSDKSFWEKSGIKDLSNPWEGASINAPFDHKYYLVINLAVGGTSGYFAQGVGGKPWSNKSPHSTNQFYNAKDQWYPSWKDTQFLIDYVKITDFTPQSNFLTEVLDNLYEINKLEKPQKVKQCISSKNQDIESFVGQLLQNSTTDSRSTMMLYPQKISQFVNSMPQIINCVNKTSQWQQLKKVFGINSFDSFKNHYQAFIIQKYSSAHKSAVKMNKAWQNKNSQEFSIQLSALGHQIAKSK